MDNYKKIGEVPPVSAREAGDTVWGLGFEKLDRAVFDPEKAYDKVAELGVRHIRIQSGWARSEKTKGIYEFEWLDEIVNNLIQRGLEPWICLCYGNGLYDEAARKVFGAVGCPPIQTEQQRQAWSNYVTALTAHYRGQVSRYEIWNEPDGLWCWKHGVSGAEYGEFAKATAAAIRKGDPDAEVIGGAVCLYNFSWLTEMFETGVAESLDAISYHAYLPDEFRGIANVRSLKSLSLRYNPKLRFIQGETGTQSREGGAGALHEGAWTPEKQAKFLARMLLIHFAEGVEINSYFSCLDMIEALNGKVGEKASYLDYGYFGVLGAEFDADGRSTGEYRPKPAYRTLQTLAAIFRGELIAEELPVRLLCDQLSPRLMRNDDSEKNELLTFGYRKKQGAGFVYWKPVELLTTTYASTISLEIAGVEGEPRLVDLLDGTIYAIPESAIEITGKNSRRFLHLPLRDYPLLLSFGNFIG
ncbi:beta-galactosidase [uncultured Victivallis sp.]|uniref:GH39 family glycosyl hydrolase n=1 Tax=uncultured Victivallis sp. TaxID=354118 RepID=UPI0025EEFE51|nr:beta-galactosidase [uncultured Victivallis sp.]